MDTLRGFWPLLLLLTVPLAGWAGDAPPLLSERCAAELGQLLQTDPAQAAEQAKSLLEQGNSAPECLLVLAHAQILQNRPIWALRTLARWPQAVSPPAPDTSTWYHLLLCQALYDSQQFDEASVACSDSALEDVWAGKYLQGMAFFREDRFPESAAALSHPVLRGASPSHQRAAGSYQVLAMLAEWGMTPGVSGSVETRIGFDSNPYFAAEDVPLLNGDVPSSAPFSRFSGAVDWNSPPVGPHWFRLSGFVTGNAYPFGEAKDISSLMAATQMEAVRLFRLARRTATVRAVAGADVIAMRGGPRLRDSDPHLFRRDLFFAAGLSVLPTPRLRVGLDIETAQARFRELARNGWLQTLRIPVTAVLTDSLFLVGTVRGGYHHTASAYRRWGAGLQSAVQWRWHPRFAVLFGAELDWGLHPESAHYFQATEDRQDWTWALRTGLSWRFWRQMECFVDGEARMRTSTASSYEFNRLLVSGGLRWEF